VSDIVVTVSLLGSSIFQVNNSKHQIRYNKSHNKRDENKEQEGNNTDGGEQGVENIRPAIKGRHCKENEHARNDIVKVVVAVDDVADFDASFVDTGAIRSPITNRGGVNFTRQTDFARVSVDAPNTKRAAEKLNAQDRKNEECEEQHDEDGR